MLEDKSGTENIHSIALASGFRPLPGGAFAAGYTRSVHWLRFTVSAPAGEWWLDILPPYLEDLRLYEPDPAQPGSFIERRGGAAFPFDQREVDYRGHVFKLHHADDGPRTYYLRLATTSTSIVVPRIWAPEAFFANATLEVGLLMATLAVLLLAMLLNFNSWFWLREGLTLWFIAYLVSLSVNFMSNDGFVQQYLAPSLPEANIYAIRVSGLCSVAFGYAFYRRLFMIERSQRFLFWLYEANFCLPLLALVLLPFGYYTETMPLITTILLPMTLVGTWLAFRQWRRKYVGGAMMLVANLTTQLGILLFALNIKGGIAGGFFLLYSLQLSSLGTILALQVALAMRLSSQRQDRQQALEAVRLAEIVVKSERDLNAQQGMFLSMLSHEMRNGLSVLRMAIAFQPMPPKTIGIAERAIQVLSDVIERSLQSVRLVDGEVSLERQPCDVAGLVEAVAADSQNPERISIDFAARPTINTDPKLLHIILTNLIENALKYGAANGPVQLALTTEDRPPPNITIRVSNAIGLAGRPDPERVFEKYYRALQTQGYTGSGVGLHLASALARLLGGELRYLDEAEAVVFQLRV